MSRYYVYNFSIGNPIVVDTVEKTLTIYSINIYGQLFDLKSGGERVNISSQRTQESIKRLQEHDCYVSSFSIDRYVYQFLMTDEQRKMCGQKLEIQQQPIYSGDSYSDMITQMCEWAYPKNFFGRNQLGELERAKYTQYYKEFLQEKSQEQTEETNK